MLPFNLHSFDVYEFTCANCDACSLSEDKKSHITKCFQESAACNDFCDES